MIAKGLITNMYEEYLYITVAVEIRSSCRIPNIPGGFCESLFSMRLILETSKISMKSPFGFGPKFFL